VKALVTGGAGFIGVNLVRKLQSEGWEPGVYDSLIGGVVGSLPAGTPVVEGDVRDTDALAAAMAGVDVVFHLAAFGSVVDSIADPVDNFSMNVEGTFSALEGARRAGVGKFIFASTGGALIGDAEPPVNELSLPRPISPYGASKLCGEAYCHAYAKSFGLDTVCTRFANVYGPYSGHKKGVITRYIKGLFRNEPFTVFGDGSSSRDYVHVSDLCNGIFLAATSATDPGEVFHLASGVETTIMTLAKTIARTAGKEDYPIEFLPPRVGEVDRNYAGFDKARDVLGFNPAVSLDRGLEETWQWYVANRDEVLAMTETDS